MTESIGAPKLIALMQRRRSSLTLPVKRLRAISRQSKPLRLRKGMPNTRVLKD